MTFHQLLEEDRVYIIHTVDTYWDIYGNKHECTPSTEYNWEIACMTYQMAVRLNWELPIRVNQLPIFIDNCSETIRKLAAREDPNDTRSISERPFCERQLPVIPYTPKRKKKSDGVPLWANILIGIPLSILRSALKL